MNFFRFLISACVFLFGVLPLKAADIALKVDVSPQRWELKGHSSLKVKFIVTLSNSSDEEKLISLYFLPKIALSLSNGSGSIESGTGADMPAVLDASDIIKLGPHKSYVYHYDATLKRQDGQLLLTGVNKKTLCFWSLEMQDGKYDAKFIFNSSISSWSPNRLGEALKARLWIGEVVSEPQMVIVNS